MNMYHFFWSTEEMLEDPNRIHIEAMIRYGEKYCRKFSDYRSLEDTIVPILTSKLWKWVCD